MNTTLSHKSGYVNEFYSRTINDLFGSEGILSRNIIGFNLDDCRLSIGGPQDNRVLIQITGLHSVDLPEVGIQKNATYDCFIGSEKVPGIRFFADQDGKITVLFANKHTFRPNQIKIVEFKGKSDQDDRLPRSTFINRIRDIFSSKK